MSESAMQSTVSKANGITPPVAGKKRHFSEDFMRSVVARVKKGEAISAVGAEYQITSSVIRRWIKSAGTKVKRGGTKPLKGVSIGPTGRKAYSEDFQRRAVERLQGGEGALELAEKLDIHNSMLYAWANKLGVKLKPFAKKQRDGTDPRYTEAFKRNVVRRYRSGDGVGKIAKELKVDKKKIYYWASMEVKDDEPTLKSAATGVPHSSKAAISYLKHSLSAKSDRVRVALVTLALATLEGEL